MSKKDLTIRRKHRQRARGIFKNVIADEGFEISKQIKFGARYYIAEGLHDNNKALFKSCIYPKSYDHLTNQKFSREVLFLDFLRGSRFKIIKQTAPHIYASGTKTRAWYIREYVSGKVQNINGGNIRFKKDFFTPKSLRWTLDTLFDLHRIKGRHLPTDFKKLLYTPQTLNYLWRFIGPYLDYVEHTIAIKESGKQIKELFNHYATTYKNTPRVLAHQELYAPHVIDVHGQFKIIDWENVGWASIVKDAVTIWMRAYQNPQWQHRLHTEFKKHYRSFKQFDDLWTATVLVQCVFNVIGYHFYNDKIDFKPMAQFSKKTLRAILSNTFKGSN